MAAYVKYGISKELVERVKRKAKQPGAQEKLKQILEGVTKQDLQSHSKVRALLSRGAKALGVSLTAQETEGIVAFVIAQKIDPNNTFHLIKLWGMFR